MRNISILVLVLFTACTSNRAVNITSEKTNLSSRKGKVCKARKLTFTSVLNVNADSLFERYSESSFMMRISSPKGILKPKNNYRVPLRWVQNTTDSFNLTVQSFVPMGSHFIFWERIDRKKLEIQTREKGGFVSVWDCFMKITPLSDSTCLYRDEVVIRAGILTGFTALWAKDFYKHRHKNLLKMEK